jgi:cytochrome c oxidase subunit 2
MKPTNVLSARGRRLLFGVLIVAFVLIASGCASNVGPQDYMSPEGPVSRRADQLWDITFAIATVMFVIVEGLIVFALIKFRHRPGRQAAQFHGNTKLEVILTLVPALILAGLAIPTVKAIADLSQKPDNALEVKVVGHQFWWEYQYSDLDLITANELHVPINQPVYVTLESVDVIHSFWIPKLTGKQDVVPGRINHMWFEAEKPGTYYGQCTEYCGLSHANMRLRVIAMTPPDFQTWVSEQQQPAQSPSDPLAAEGEKVFLEGACVNCHAVEGTDAQARLGPDLTHFASRATFAGAIFDNNTENLVTWLRDPPAVKPGSQMPNYNLSEDDINALVAYLQSLE